MMSVTGEGRAVGRARASEARMSSGRGGGDEMDSGMRQLRPDCRTRRSALNCRPAPRPRAPPRLSHWAAPAPLTRRARLRRAQTQSCGQRRRGRGSTSIRFRFLEPPAEGEPSLGGGGRECLHYSSCLSKGTGRRETEKSWRAEGRAWNRRVSVQSHGGRNCADGAEVREPAGRPRAAILVTT